MQIPLRKHPVAIVTALLIIVILVWGYWPQPVLVEAIAVKRAPLTISIEEEGRTRVIDRYIISAPVDGVACRVQLKVGDAVEQNQVLLNNKSYRINSLMIQKRWISPSSKSPLRTVISLGLTKLNIIRVS